MKLSFNADLDDCMSAIPRCAHSRVQDKAGYGALDPMKTEKSEIPEAALSLRLNRHFDVLPNPMTRVHLTELPGEPASGYINANFVRGFGGRPQAYICAQGAMEDTVDSFWRMVRQL